MMNILANILFWPFYLGLIAICSGICLVREFWGRLVHKKRRMMKFKLKYKTSGRVESYIAVATSYISFFADQFYAEHERVGVLSDILDVVVEQATNTKKGLTANPCCRIVENEDPELIVWNTCGREVLRVYFDRVETQYRRYANHHHYNQQPADE